jgi:hypothetical protein
MMSVEQSSIADRKQFIDDVKFVVNLASMF